MYDIRGCLNNMCNRSSCCIHSPVGLITGQGDLKLIYRDNPGDGFCTQLCLGRMIVAYGGLDLNPEG